MQVGGEPRVAVYSFPGFQLSSDGAPPPSSRVNTRDARGRTELSTSSKCPFTELERLGIINGPPRGRRMAKVVEACERSELRGGDRCPRSDTLEKLTDPLLADSEGPRLDLRPLVPSLGTLALDG